MMTNKDLQRICNQFDLYGEFLVGVPFGTGHINDTYQITYDQGGARLHYTLQRINHHVFRNPVLVMENMRRVTEHLKKKFRKANIHQEKRTLELIHTRNSGDFFVQEKDGNYYRLYVFVEEARAYDFLETPAQAYAAAESFGGFVRDLLDLPGERLHETIPDFHNTPKRLEMLKDAVKLDSEGRVKKVRKELDFIFERASDIPILTEMQRRGELKERITHNDTKLNNILFDDMNGNAICVTDLDTVMPGLPHYDFGDMVRTGASSANEDETDLSKVTVRMDFFEALLKGYCKSAKSFLNDAELEYLPFSGKLITLEIGMRFLTDYIEGDRYFKIHRPEHNLDRARNQLKLVSEIEKSLDTMKKLLLKAKK